MSNHVMPNGARITNYKGQLAVTGHKFGKHFLTEDCPCEPGLEAILVSGPKPGSEIPKGAWVHQEISK